MRVQSEDVAPYAVNRFRNHDDEVIAKAMDILFSRLRKPNEILAAPDSVKRFLQLKLTTLEHEVFGVLFLDAQHGLITYEEMFRGTLTQTSVYPREVVKMALSLNCASVVLAHNHPSGNTNPSRADEMLTQTLKSALALVDVRVLDHIIVGGQSTLSFAETGLI